MNIALYVMVTIWDILKKHPKFKGVINSLTADESDKLYLEIQGKIKEAIFRAL